MLLALYFYRKENSYSCGMTHGLHKDVFGLEISASTPYAFMLQFILDLCFNLHTTHECFILHKYFYVADLSCIESFLFGEISKKL